MNSDQQALGTIIINQGLRLFMIHSDPVAANFRCIITALVQSTAAVTTDILFGRRIEYQMINFPAAVTDTPVGNSGQKNFIVDLDIYNTIQTGRRPCNILSKHSLSNIAGNHQEKAWHSQLDAAFPHDFNCNIISTTAGAFNSLASPTLNRLNASKDLQWKYEEYENVLKALPDVY